MRPYRELAVVEPLSTDPHVHALRLAGALPFVAVNSYDCSSCPFCDISNTSYDYRGPQLSGPICIGATMTWNQIILGDCIDGGGRI